MPRSVLALALSLLIALGALAFAEASPDAAENPPAILDREGSWAASLGTGTPSGEGPVAEPAAMTAFAIRAGTIDYVAAGTAMRNQGYGTIRVTWSGAIVAAFLVWSYMADSTPTSGTLNGVPITGSVVAKNPQNPCWASTIHTLVADVTTIVVNGPNALSGFPSQLTGGEDPWASGSNVPLLEGASLVVIYTVAGPGREITLFVGAQTIFTNNARITETLPHATAQSPSAKTTFIVSDGQMAGNDARWNGAIVDSNAFPGSDPRTSTIPWAQGNLFDTRTYAVTVPIGSTADEAVISDEGSPGDCLTWNAQVLRVDGTPAPDAPPTAVAQASPTVVHLGEVVTFDGTGSTDDHGILAYDWDLGDGARDSNPVTTHAYASRASFVVTLTVRDTIGQTDTDTETVDVVNWPPEANAGIDRSVSKGTVVMLDGTRSSDRDGDPLTFSWRQSLGPTVTLVDADTPTPTFTPTASGILVFTLTVDDGWGGTASDSVTVFVSNRAPVANAGMDRTVTKRTTVGLDGTASYDPDGDALSYSWTQVYGPSATLNGADTAMPWFVPATRGLYRFQLTVNDGDGGTATDLVEITATNTAPIADAGQDRTVPKKAVVILDGSRSSDPDGDPITYSWRQTAGPSVALGGATTAWPSFTAPRSGTYAFELTVNDGDGGIAKDVVQVTATNQPPVANAGPDVATLKKTPVTLDGTASWDIEGDPLTFSWAQVSGPVVVLTGSGSATPTLTPPLSGVYVFRLTVNDGDGGIATDLVQVTATNRAPTADAGTDRTVFKNAPVTLDGTGSADPDGDALAFSWTQIGGPPVMLTGADTATPAFTPAASATYGFRLVVDDGDGGTASATVQITATNRAPTADAGTDRTAQKRVPATLDGSRSSDPDGDALDYAWTQIAGPGATIANADTAGPTFTPASVGTYAFRLRVDDGDGGIAEDEVSLIVWSLPPGAVLAANPRHARIGEPIAFDGAGSWDVDGVVTDYAFAFGDGGGVHGSDPVANHVFESGGTFPITLSVTDDDGNVSAPVQITVTVEGVAAPPIRVTENWKPLVAIAFAAILTGAGASSSRRRPWYAGRRASRLLAFALTALPFVLAELATGALSRTTGMLSIPPLVGWGMAVDLAILATGLSVAIARAVRSPRSLPLPPPPTD